MKGEKTSRRVSLLGEQEGWKANKFNVYVGATNFQWRQLLKLHARQIEPPGERGAIPGFCQRRGPFYLYLNLKMERSRENEIVYANANRDK